MFTSVCFWKLDDLIFFFFLERFEEDERINSFLGAELICSSPLTRALMTAIIGLQDHPYCTLYILELVVRSTFEWRRARRWFWNPRFERSKKVEDLTQWVLPKSASKLMILTISWGVATGADIKKRAMDSIRREMEKDVSVMLHQTSIECFKTLRTYRIMIVPLKTKNAMGKGGIF